MVLSLWRLQNRPQKLGTLIWYMHGLSELRFIFGMNATVEYRKTTILIQKKILTKGVGWKSPNSQQIYFVSDLETL